MQGVIMKRIHDLMQEPDILPESFFSMIDTGMSGIRAIAVIMAALDLRIFDLLNKPQTICDLARKSGTDPTTLAPFCEALVAMGLLRFSLNRYRVTLLALTYLDAVKMMIAEKR